MSCHDYEGIMLVLCTPFKHANIMQSFK